MIVLTSEKYHKICRFIRNFKGLAIDCEVNLIQKFPEVPKLTLGKITQIQVNT